MNDENFTREDFLNIRLIISEYITNEHIRINKLLHSDEEEWAKVTELFIRSKVKKINKILNKLEFIVNKAN